MWAKNLLFMSVCAAGLLAFKASVFPAARLDTKSAVTPPDKSLREIVAQVDAGFERAWSASGLKPAALAHELAIARRMSLALAGTIPSLEEIRRFESWPEGERLERHLAEDRFFLAEKRGSAHLAPNVTFTDTLISV